MPGSVWRFLLLVAGCYQRVAAHKHHRRHSHHAGHRHHSDHAAHHGHSSHQIHEHHHSESVADVQLDVQQMDRYLMKVEEELQMASKRLIAIVANSTAAAKPAGNLRKPPLHHLSNNLKESLHKQEGKLQDLFKHLKVNIASFNKRESDSRHSSQKMEEKLKKRLAEDQARLKEKNITAFEHEMLTNRTRTEEHEIKYWSRGRELQHNMFHSNLKLTHGLMSRVKMVMDAYKDVLAKGALDPKVAQALHSTSMLLPKAFLQKQQKFERKVHKYGKHVRKAKQLLERHGHLSSSAAPIENV